MSKPAPYSCQSCPPEDNFKLLVTGSSLYSEEYGTEGSEIIFDLGASIGVHTVFLLTDYYDATSYRNIFGSYVHICDDQTLTTSDCEAKSTMIQDGGYFPLQSVPTGRYLGVRRPYCQHMGDCSSWSENFSLYQTRLYQVPNLIQSFNSQIIA